MPLTAFGSQERSRHVRVTNQGLNEFFLAFTNIPIARWTPRRRVLIITPTRRLGLNSNNRMVGAWIVKDCV
jgi:hypothetical protein